MARGLTRILPAPLVLVLGSCAADTSEVVPAIRYRQLIAEGIMDVVHGGGLWHDVFYLTESGIEVQVVWKHKPGDAASATEPEMHAYYAPRPPQLDAGSRPAPKGARLVEPEPDSKVERITIPSALAGRIVMLANQTKSLRALAVDLGMQAVTEKAVRGPDSVKPRWGPDD